MTYYEYATVKNNLVVDTKYGKKTRVVNVILEDRTQKPIWIKDINSLSYLKPNEKVKVIRGVNNSLTILEDETSPGSTQPTQSSYQSNRNGHSSPSNDIEDILDLPVLSDVDKRNMMGYIRGQSKLLKFCYDTVCQDFPDLAINDPRGARSLAVTLLISANTCRDRYQK